MNIHELQEAYGKALTAHNRGDYNQALRLLDSLLLKEPTFVPAWNLRGNTLEKVGASFDAMVNFTQGLSLAPGDAALYNNRGASRLSMREYKAALTDFESALRLDPTLSKGHQNKGNTYRRMVKIKESVWCYRKAIELDPNNEEAHLGLSMSLLELGEFVEGWREFEWRFKTDQAPPRGLPQPRWVGHQADSPDDVLLIYGEQGFGDVLQFMRYAVEAKKVWRGRVALEVRLPLHRIAKTMKGIDEVLIMGEKLPDNIKAQIPVMSLPDVVGTDVGFHGSYLAADDHLTGIWAAQLAQMPPGARVGLCWAGQNREDQPVASAIDARRSLNLESFASVAKVKDIIWVSLQKGGPASQVKTPPQGMMIADLTSNLYDFYDTAALIKNLDLVISVDTAVVHLAGALGVPTWMLSRFDGCWRWLGNRKDSPWYPSLRQYRQQAEGDWSNVFDELRHDLQRFVVQRRVDAHP